MFDLLGLIDLFAPLSPGALPRSVLPAAQSVDTKIVLHRTVEGQHFQATYLERISDPATYSFDGTLHLFLIGEAFARNSELLHETYEPGPLSAYDILQRHRRDSSGFLHAIKGNFTLIILNVADRQCCLYNSRFGISPFYYALDGTRFIFSTSLAAVGSCLSARPEVDLAAVAELAIFNYPFGDRTYFRQVKMLRPAEIVRVGASGLQRETWWDVRTLDSAPLYPRLEALELGSELFHNTVNRFAHDVPRVRMSFTSGFDSRATLAVLEKDHADLLAYSFGTPGSMNVSIPQQICARLGVQFCPIYLDGEYEQVFDKYALQAIRLSDCLSTVERANYPYAFEKIASFSPIVITGLFGSELMRTFQSVGDVISETLARLNFAVDPCDEFRRIATRHRNVGYFAPEILDQAVDEVEADVAAVLAERFRDMPPDRRFYMFLLTEGLRKYFGAEVHMERPWATTRFPFLDDDFVEFIFSSPFAGVHSRTLRPTINNRFQSQYFYAWIIRKYRAELLDAPTDHGYPPSDLLSPLPLLKIGPKFLHWKWKQRRTGYREFKTEEWTGNLYGRYLFQTIPRCDLFSQKMMNEYRDGTWRKNWPEYAKAASLKLWLEMIGLN